jgi:hypothetical protein
VAADTPRITPAPEEQQQIGSAAPGYELTALTVSDWEAQFLAAAPQVFEKGARRARLTVTIPSRVIPTWSSGWHLSRSLDHHLTLKALGRALAGGHCPLIHHSDQGRQYACKDCTDLLKQEHLHTRMTAVGNP